MLFISLDSSGGEEQTETSSLKRWTLPLVYHLNKKKIDLCYNVTEKQSASILEFVIVGLSLKASLLPSDLKKQPHKTNKNQNKTKAKSLSHLYYVL